MNQCTKRIVGILVYNGIVFLKTEKLTIRKMPMMKPAWSWDGGWIERNGGKGMQVQLLKW